MSSTRRGEGERTASRTVVAVECASVQPTKAKRNPKMSRHSSGQARVRLSGRTHYLGEWGSLDAQARYVDLVREWRDGGKQPLGSRTPHAGELAFTVEQLLQEYRDWIDATGRYTKAGRKTTGHSYMLHALASFERFMGKVPVLKLTDGLIVQWRDRLEVDCPKMTRGGVNKKVCQVLAALRWGRKRGHVAPATWASCKSVDPLKRGECSERPEHCRERRAVTMAEVEKLAPHCRSSMIIDLMRLQLASAMRPGEAVAMRWADIDKNGPNGTWIYTVPGGGKSAHRGRSMRYFLGAAAQRVLAARPTTLPTAPLFPISEPAYRESVRRACRRCDVQHFSPHELRHGALTAIAEQAGVSAASAAANHKNVATTARYLHRDDKQALAAVAVLDRATTG